MMQQHTIHIAGGVVRNPLVRLTEPVTLDFLAGEHIAIVGPNGAGKSLLVDMLTGKYPLRDGELTYDFSPSLTKTAYDNIKYIAFRDTYGSADANYYYQQRWNAHDQEDAPLVREVLGEVKDDALRRQLFELFSIEPMLDKKIILLSSGEMRLPVNCFLICWIGLPGWASCRLSLCFPCWMTYLHLLHTLCR